MNCDELLLMLNDYVDGEVDPAVCETLEAHLQGCDPCQVVVDNIRRTISLYRGEEIYEFPLELRERLCASLRERWQSAQGSSEPGPAEG